MRLAPECVGMVCATRVGGSGVKVRTAGGVVRVRAVRTRTEHARKVDAQRVKAIMSLGQRETRKQEAKP